jgi:paraquat-inducible protein A
MSTGTASRSLTARDAGLEGCRACGRVWPQGQEVCGRCGVPMAGPREMVLQRVWAWLAAAVILYIPANLYPMLQTTQQGKGDKTSTIVGGIVDLVEHRDYAVALIVLLASVVVPIGKFIAIAVLAIGLRRRSMLSRHRRLRLLTLADFIGRWSMIDVFVVAILSSLVQLGFAAQVHPGPAAVAYALSVACTMLAAQHFDPRLIWEHDRPSGQAVPG